MKLGYREDVDGLRAIAVLAVIFYHVGLGFFSGGFIGVDIFFVISGYLITTIIIREIDDHDFSLARFYERRIRRIFPALFTVLTATLLLSAILYNANGFQKICESLNATVFFGSNILFWTQAGYFEGPSELKPLLHTWSLAVEEQFYIIFPLLMLILARFLRSKLSLAVIFLAIASFTWNIFGMAHDPSGAFYLTHMRMWELLIGSLLALKIIPAKIGLPIRNFIGFIGLLMLALPIFLYTKDTPFPGFAAVLPTMGTAMVLYSGSESKTVVGHFLGLRPIVFIGQISYSLYLWHWPLITFAKYYNIITLSPLEIVAVLLVIFLVSALSWKYVETPFRQKTFLKRRGIFQFAASVMLITFAISSIILMNKGFPGRFSEIRADVNSETDTQWKKWSNCAEKVCTIGADTDNYTFLLWGDSHARSVATAMEVSAKKEGVTGYVATLDGCPPILGINLAEQDYCYEFNNQIIKNIQKHPNLGTIFLTGRWPLYAVGERYANEDGASIVLHSMDTDNPSITNAGTNEIIFTEGVEKTIKELVALDRRVIIVLTIPEVGYNVPSSYFIAFRSGRDINAIIAPTLDQFLKRNRIVIDLMTRMQTLYHVQITDPTKVLCDTNNCNVVIDGQPLYRDGDHLSTFGSLYISNIFNPLFDELAHSSP
jgi:peptidoglycan/LPS O-acetylase OafA/YrhL